MRCQASASKEKFGTRVQGVGSISKVFHGAYKAIAALGKGLDEPQILGRIAQGLAQAPDGVIQAVVKVDKRIRRPDFLLQLFSRDDLSGLCQESLQAQR